ncbi:PrgI family protein [Herbidospora cretacea]|uniref:PrgI family protein n=1 Tax=Herbidospora cretacea TaxID=28444 RepID=UPI0007746D08|nr:PrgI family protein [Herbidospora cretacea]
MPDDEHLITRIPSDVDQPDKIAYGLTVRQLVIVALTGGIAAGVYALFHELLPVLVTAAVLLPLVAVGIALALGRRDGLSLDQFAFAALLFARTPRRLVTAAEGVSEPPRWCRLRGKLPAPLRLPVRAIRTDGALELAEGGVAVLVETSTISFHLRTPAEQAALVGAFGRWLNSLDAPAQILIRATPIDLGHLVQGINERTGALPHPALARAAAEHTDFLEHLGASTELLTRQVLIVLREHQPAGGRRRPRRDACATVVLRRAAETEHTLAALGVNARVLDASAAHRVLAECLDPGGWHPAPVALPDDLITSEVGQ